MKIVTYDAGFNAGDIAVLLIGMAVAYLVSLGAIKFLMSFVKKHSFSAFGVYRIVLGIIVVLCAVCGLIA